MLVTMASVFLENIAVNTYLLSSGPGLGQVPGQVQKVQGPGLTFGLPLTRHPLTTQQTFLGEIMR